MKILYLVYNVVIIMQFNIKIDYLKIWEEHRRWKNGH